MLHQEKAIDEAMQKFKEWVKDVRSDAQSQGVSEEVLDWALENIELSKESLVHTESMPEVKLTLDDYLKRSNRTPSYHSTITMSSFLFQGHIMTVDTGFFLL